MEGICGWFGNTPGRDASVCLDAMATVIADVSTRRSFVKCSDTSLGAIASTQTIYQSSDRSLSIAFVGKSHLTPEELASRYNKHGKDLPANLSGPFILAVNDTARSIQIIANDRLGVFPCYYSQVDGALVFSSRLGSLVEHPDIHPELDPQAIYNYVYFHCIPSPRTIYKGIAKLEPGQVIVRESNNFSCESYWSPDLEVREQEFDGEAAQTKLLNLLEEAVANRKSDGGRSGAFLSGGLDSSTVAGMLSKVTTEPAETFTIGFDNAQYDESAWAKISADHFGTKHHEYRLTPEDVVEALPLIASFYDEPFGNSSVVPTYFCAKRAREAGINVLMAGDGGDELFAGNERYARQRLFEPFLQLPNALQSVLSWPYDNLSLLRQLPLVRKGGSYIEQAKVPLPERLQTYNFLNYFNDEPVFCADFLAQVVADEPRSQWRHRYNMPAVGSSLKRMLYLDWKFTLADNDLVKVNNMCALAGVDVVYPMLDEQLVEFSITVPDNVLMPGRKLRDFYKSTMRGFLTDQTIDKPKHGFGLPFGVWINSEPRLRELAYESLESLRDRNIIEGSFIDLAKSRHQQGAESYYGELIWVLMMLEQWLLSHNH